MDTGVYDAVLYPLKSDARPESASRVADYFSLLKPRATALHLFTASVAMFLASQGFPPVKTLALVVIGGGLVAGSSNALNCYFDRNLDALMERTRNRPLPTGRLSPRNALAFGLVCGAVGLTLLSWLSFPAAALAFAAFASYGLVYTLWLKGKGGAGTVLSSGIGAVPPVIGWLAVTGHLSAVPFLLFGIIAFWTPPHFWSLALSRGGEYRGARLAVLPGNKPEVWTAGFVMLTVAASLAVIPAAYPGLIYTASAGLLGLAFLSLCLTSIFRPGLPASRLLYVYSIIYLVLLFTAMLAGMS
jgi:protoheme IX farnesyltransferase